MGTLPMHQTLRLAMMAALSLSFTTLNLGLTIVPATPVPAPATATSTANFARHFQDLGVEGSIVVANLKGDRVVQHNPKRNATAFSPASTFKILNSLIALETKVIPDEVAVLTWDGIPRAIPEWNRDLNLREAYKLSAVWFYQVLARRAGPEAMQKWVTAAQYGNQKIGGPADIDKFWLQGELRITPQEQIRFLRRLYANELPFGKGPIAKVKDLMIMEQTPDYTLRGKTGWAGFGDSTQPQIGWLVGYVEKGPEVYFFAVNLDLREKKDPAARMTIVRRCLKDLGVL
jgi:beta-lactamase class D